MRDDHGRRGRAVLSLRGAHLLAELWPPQHGRLYRSTKPGRSVLVPKHLPALLFFEETNMNEQNTRAGIWKGVRTLAVLATAIAGYLWWNRTPPMDRDTISIPMVFR